MNASKLGLSLTSSVLATALVLAPVHGALAAPAEGEDAADEEGAPEGEEGAEGEAGEEGAEGEPAEGEEGAEGEPAEGEEGAEGEPAEGEEGAEGEPAEGEEGAEGEEVAEGEGEGEEAGEGEGEGEDEGEAMEVAEPEIQPEGPLRPPEPTWGPKDQYPMNGKGMLITGGIVTGLGAAFIGTAVAITSCNFDSALSCRYGDQRNFLVPTAVAATGLGLLFIGVGVGNHVRYKRWQNWTPEQTAVVPTMMERGGGVAWVGKF